MLLSPRDRYLKEWGEEEGMKKGMKEGIEKGKKESIDEYKLSVAGNLLNMGVCIDEIVEATGLDKNVILDAKDFLN